MQSRLPEGTLEFKSFLRDGLGAQAGNQEQSGNSFVRIFYWAGTDGLAGGAWFCSRWRVRLCSG